jgi:hypothetical protein
LQLFAGIGERERKVRKKEKPPLFGEKSTARIDLLRVNSTIFVNCGQIAGRMEVGFNAIN